MEEAHVVTPIGSYLIDKDLRVDVVQVDHAGEGDPHAQESCRRGRRNQVHYGGPQWSTMGGPRHAELLVRIMTRSPTHGWGVGAIITVLTLQKGKQSWGGIRTEKLREWEPS